FREVWGLERVLLAPTETSSSVHRPTQGSSAFVGFVVAENLSAEGNALLQKMLTATKLSETQIRVTSSFREAQDWDCWIALTPPPDSFRARGFWLESFGPHVLVKSPEFKRKTWDDIQKLLFHFNSRRSLSEEGLQSKPPSERASI
ncbi:MAG: hypothetical protein WCH11_06845, partial [Bdellovibrio sp.]